MPTSTQQTGMSWDEAIRRDLAIPTADQVYDSLMASIEPELTTAQLPLLDEKYKDESAENAAVRAERYKAAFEKFSQAFATYLSGLNHNIQRYVRTAFASAESEEREHEATDMQAIEAAINS